MMRSSSFTMLLVAIGLWIGGVAVAAPRSETSGRAGNTYPSASMDRQLDRGLSRALLEDVGTKQITMPPAGAVQPPGDAGDGAGNAALANPSFQPNALEQIGLEMRAVKARIAHERADANTQQMQQAIVDQLTALVEQAKSQCQGQCSGVSQCDKPAAAKAGSKPASDSVRDSSNKLTPQKPVSADPGAIRQRMQEAWGNLPERLREQMQQSPVDEFLPKYELLIEEYFKRLSGSNDAPTTDGPPDTTPSSPQ